MPGTLNLTAAEQTTLTNALRLEQAGFPQAAQWLRDRIPVLQLIDWSEPPSRPSDTDAVVWEALFRAHRGSAAPLSPLIHVTTAS